jgi:hypothetical protein
MEPQRLSDLCLLQLASPLFLFALVVVNREWRALHNGGPCRRPPVVHDIWGFYNFGPANPEQRRRRLNAAITAARIVAQWFMRCGWASPGGVCFEAQIVLEGCPPWVHNLSRMHPRVALQRLSEGAMDWQRRGEAWAETESLYNAGVADAAKTFPALARLNIPQTGGELARRCALLQDELSVDELAQIGTRILEHSGDVYLVTAHPDAEGTAQVLGLWCHTGTGPAEMTAPKIVFDVPFNFAMGPCDPVQLTDTVEYNYCARTRRYQFIGPRIPVLTKFARYIAIQVRLREGIPPEEHPDTDFME